MYVLVEPAGQVIRDEKNREKKNNKFFLLSSSLLSDSTIQMCLLPRDCCLFLRRHPSSAGGRSSGFLYYSASSAFLPSEVSRELGSVQTISICAGEGKGTNTVLRTGIIMPTAIIPDTTHNVIGLLLPHDQHLLLPKRTSQAASPISRRNCINTRASQSLYSKYIYGVLKDIYSRVLRTIPDIAEICL